MIVLWLGYALGVSAALMALALAAEYVLRLYGRPTRWLWATSLVGSLVLPVLAWLLAPVARAAAGPAGVTLGQPMVLAAGAAPVAAAPPPAPWHAWLAAALTRSGPFLLDGWVLASLLLAMLVLVSYLRLRRQRVRWRDAEVDGVRVFVSGALGPAVVGLRRPRIVVPEWVLGESEARRRLILAHEAEHVAAGDGRLLAGAYGALVLAPWNALVWWQVRRLRLAAEVDCDARVVRRGADLRGYAGLLLKVGERFGAAAPAAAFAEPRSLLSRRLRVLTAVPPARRGWRAAAVALAGLTVAALACVAPRPDRPGEVSPTEPIEAPKVVAAATPADTPSFTAYTVAPELANRDEVTKALRDSYPPLLREAGVGGTSLIWVHLDRAGQVLDARIKKASGHAEVDSAAVHVGRTMRFSPALNGTEPVAIWIALPIVFKTSQPEPHGADSAPSAKGTPPEGAASRTPDERMLRQGPTVTPYTEAPTLSNRAEVMQALVGAYPPALKEAEAKQRGLHVWAVHVWVLVGRDGRVQATRIKDSSGRSEADSAAVRVARAMNFAPARNGTEIVPVWIALPIFLQSAPPSRDGPAPGSAAEPAQMRGAVSGSDEGQAIYERYLRGEMTVTQAADAIVDLTLREKAAGRMPPPFHKPEGLVLSAAVLRSAAALDAELNRLASGKLLSATDGRAVNTAAVVAATTVPVVMGHH